MHPDGTPPSRPAALPAWLLLALYTGSALVFTYPTARYLGTHVLGVRYDLWGNLWLLDYFAQELKHGRLGLHTTLLMYPRGFSLWGYGHFLLQLAAAPLLALVSVPTLYTLMVWAGLIASAWCMYLLALRVVREPWAACICGALYTFHGLKYAELAVGSLEQAVTFGLPLYACSLLDWHAQRTLRKGAQAYGVLMITSACNWFFGLALTLFTVLFGCCTLLRKRADDTRWHVDVGWVGCLVALGLACALSVLPVLGKVQGEIYSRPALQADLAQRAASSQAGRDVPRSLELLTPAFLDANAIEQTLYDVVAVDRLLREDMGLNPHEAGPGAMLIILAVLGALAVRRGVVLWALTAIVFLLLSLGPFLVWHDTAGPSQILLAPYYLLYNYVPWSRVGYRPYRYESMALVGLAVLSAHLLAMVFRRIPAPRHAAVLGTCLLATILWVRCIACTPSRNLLADARVPAYYQTLAKEQPQGAIIEVPCQHWAYSSTTARLQYYQAVHRHPLLNISETINLRQLEHLKQLQLQHPLLALLDEGACSHRLAWTPALEADRRWLIEQGFSHIVVHTSFPTDPYHLTGLEEHHEMIGEALIEVLTRLFGPPEDTGEALVFHVRPAATESRPAATESRPLAEAEVCVTSLETTRAYHRVGCPVTLPEDGLQWTPPELELQRVVLWASAPRPDMSLAVEIYGATREGRDTHRTVQVAVPCGAWKRLSIAAASSDEKITRIAIHPARAADNPWMIDAVQVVERNTAAQTAGGPAHRGVHATGPAAQLGSGRAPALQRPATPRARASDLRAATPAEAASAAHG